MTTVPPAGNGGSGEVEDVFGVLERAEYGEESKEESDTVAFLASKLAGLDEMTGTAVR